MKNKKRLWLIAWPIGLGAAALYNVFYHHYVNPIREETAVVYWLELFIPFLSVCIMALVLSLFVSLAPLRGEKYLSKLMTYFPLALAFMSGIYTLVFMAAGPHYRAIEVDPRLECSSVRNGLFRMERSAMTIERQGDWQVQIYGDGEREEFSVRWLSECEYQITSQKQIVKVKIVAVDSLGYDCYTSSGALTSGKMRVLKIQ